MLKRKKEQKHDTSIWIADFGSEEIEKEIRDLVKKIAPKKPLKMHWLFLALVAFCLVLIIELLVRQMGTLFFWSEGSIFWVVWLIRLVLLGLWFYLAQKNMRLHPDKILAVAVFAFAAEVLVSGIIKIMVIGAAWTWINLLVEPIWMILLVGLLFNLNKLKHKKYGTGKK